MKYQDVEVEVNEKTTPDNINEQLGLNNIELAADILEIYKEEYFHNIESSSNEVNDFVFSECDRYTFNVGTFRFTIRLKDLVIGLVKDLFIDTVFSSSIDQVQIRRTIIKNIILNSNYIKEHQLCVFHQIVKWQRNHKYKETFRLEDIFPGEDCPYREKINSEFIDRWNCHSYRQDYCVATMEQYKQLLGGLCKDKFLEPIEENRYRISL